MTAFHGQVRTSWCFAVMLSPIFTGLSPTIADGQVPRPRPHEEQFVALSATLNGFGGFYFDDAGNLHVVLTDQSQAGAARLALTPVLSARPRWYSGRPAANPQIIVEAGEFAFPDLARWRDSAVSAILGKVEGATFVDLDERRNRVTIAAENEAAAARITRRAAAAGIPPGIVNVTVRGPIRLGVALERAGRTPLRAAETLSSRIRPVPGGVKIARPGSTSGTQEACTLGFNAYSGTTLVFVTNSHCTNANGGTNNTDFYQSDTFNGATDLIGREFSDPAWRSPSADPNCYYDSVGNPFYCRHSDAALVRYNDASAANVQFGYIARTASSATGMGVRGSTTISATSPRFQITGEQDYPRLGEQVHKMGVTSGWTYGTVNISCGDFYYERDLKGYLMYCQDTSDGAGFEIGDSGGPVFVVNGGTVTIFGVAWGSDSFGTLFSSMQRLELDLGALRVF